MNRVHENNKTKESYDRIILVRVQLHQNGFSNA